MFPNDLKFPVKSVTKMKLYGSFLVSLKKSKFKGKRYSEIIFILLQTISTNDFGLKFVLNLIKKITKYLINKIIG